jgi:Tol biopolymer transport system component
MHYCKAEAILLSKVKKALLVAICAVLLPCASLVAQNLALYASNVDGSGMEKVFSFDPIVTAVTNLAFSRDGSGIVLSLVEEQRPRIFRMKADGTNLTEVTTATSPASWGASFSPDGKRLMFVSQDQNNQTSFYSANTDGSAKTLVKENVWSATLSSDGKKLIFVRTQDTTGNAIFECNSDGSNEQQLVAGLGYWDPQPSISPTDPNQIAFTDDVISSDSTTTVNVSLQIYQVQAASQKVILDNSSKVYLVQKPAFSPDGMQVFFDAVGPPFTIGGQVSGDNIYTIKTDGSAMRQIVAGTATVTFFNPVVSPDGKRVFFLSGTLKH